MSVVGVSSYFLWTQKGQTTLPLVRGSGFLLPFKLQHSFYRYHVITAGHVSCPVHYKHLYGDSIGLKAIGERHVSARVLVPDPTTHRVKKSLELEFKQHFLPNVDVASLRLKQGEHLLDAGLAAFDVDPDPIEEGTEVEMCGLVAEEERANPNDDGLLLRPCRLPGVCKAALVSLDYGTVLLSSIDTAKVTSPPPSTASSAAAAPPRGGASEDGAAAAATSSSTSPPALPLSLCGGPVLRKSSGKCVGVTVARVLKNAPPKDPQSNALYQDPYLDVSLNETIHHLWPLDVAFVPIGEFFNALVRTEV